LTAVVWRSFTMGWQSRASKASEARLPERAGRMLGEGFLTPETIKAVEAELVADRVPNRNRGR
jgi:hypothetical protein